MRTRSAERRHRVQHRVDLGHDVWPSTRIVRVARRAQRHVQHRALLGHVDLVAAEHRVAADRDAAFPASCSSSRIVSSVMRFFE